MQKLPVLQTDDLKSKTMQTALKAVAAAGFNPRTAQEDDFLFSLKPADHPYVLVPLSNHVNTSALAILGHYIANGGKVILLASGEIPEPAAQRLLQLIGLNATGSASLSKPELFYWAGAALPGAESLPEGTRLILLQPGLNETVLATWGNQYPAIITTDKGALLNWPWGKQLSQTTNTIALSKVMPMSKPDSVILAQTQFGEPVKHRFREKPPKAREPKPEKLELAEAKPVDPTFNFNPAFNQQSVISVATDQKTAVAPPSGGQTDEASRSAEASVRVKPVPVASKRKLPSVTINSAEAKHCRQVAAQAAKSSAGAEDEVINNILGLPATPDRNEIKNRAVPKPDDPILKDKLDTVSQPEAGKGPQGETGKQKRFSFLEPEAAVVVAPEFDYGIYSMNLRILDDYRRRINDALETSRQLSLDMPEQKVRDLLRESDQHKHKFESLYLSNQTQLGLDEYAQARKVTLQALALTSASPQVEARAIWLDRGTILEAKNPADIGKLMQKLHHAGINIVYFETLNAGFPIYPSAITRRNPMVQGWDPLQAAVEEGHKLGMEVHAWVWAFAVGNRRHNALIGQPETYPGPILNDDGLLTEALRNQSGGLEVDGKQHEFWLSPASEKGRAFLLSIYKEIVSRYDVDGLQLDYIRYPFQTSATRMGYEPVGRDKFYRATGQSLEHLDDYIAKMWIAWKTYQVSSFVQEVSTTLKKIKPDLKLSAAVFPMKRESRIVAIQQDWETWIDNGWVDTLSPMSYTADPVRLQGMFDYVQASPQKQPLIYPGIALHRLDGAQLVQELEALRQHGGLGATLFAGAHLNQEKIDTLGQGPFKTEPSLTPHKDVVKSLQVILGDYQQKFATLQTKNMLGALSADQAGQISDGMTQLQTSLKNLATFKNPVNMPAFEIQQAQRQLNTFKALSTAWVDADKTAHPFRAQYFQQKTLLLDELLGYLSDKRTGATIVFGPPKVVSPTATAAKPSVPASSAHPTPLATGAVLKSSHERPQAVPASMTAVTPLSDQKAKSPATTD